MTKYYHRQDRPVRAALAVFKAIESRADEKTRQAFLDIRAIAAQTGLDTQTVSSAVEVLIEEGIVEATKFPRTFPQYVDVTLVENLEPHATLRERYESV